MALCLTLPDTKGIPQAFRNNEEQVYPIRESLSHGNPANIKEVSNLFIVYYSRI